MNAPYHAASAALFGLLLVGIPGHGTASDHEDVVVQVRDIQGDGGVRCALHTADSWLDVDEAVRRVEAESREGSTATCVFESVPPGTYGGAAYHDRDDDGELDRNFVGIPSEPVCVSNGPPDGFGKPSFDGAQFDHTDSETEVDCPMQS